MTLQEYAKEVELVISTVRADREIGKGTCSVVDECMTDWEVYQDYAEYSEMTGNHSILNYLKAQRRFEKARRERETWFPLAW